MTWRSKNIVYLILSLLSIYKHYEVISIGTYEIIVEAILW